MERVTSISENRYGYKSPEISLYTRLINVLDESDVKGITSENFYWFGPPRVINGSKMRSLGYRIEILFF